MSLAPNIQAGAWEVVLFRSATDPDFRSALLREPETVLRELGMLADSDTVIVHEYKADQHVLILPPLADLAPRGVQESRVRRRHPPAVLATPSGGLEGRKSYCEQPPSPPMIGPAIAAVDSPAGLSSLV